MAALDYIYYNYGNYLEFAKGSNDMTKVAQHVFANNRRMLNQQIKRFNQMKNRQIEQASRKTGLGFDEIAGLYTEMEVSPDFLRNVQDQSLQKYEVGMQGESLNINLTTCLAQIANFDKDMNFLAAGYEKLYAAVDLMILPDTKENFGKACIEEWARAAQKSGMFDRHQEVKMEVAAQRIVEDFINKQSKNNWFKIPESAGSAQKLESKHAKAVALLEAIRLVGLNGSGLKQNIDVYHGKTHLTGESDDNKLSKLFKAQASGLVTNLKETTHQAAVGAAGIAALTKISGKLNNLKFGSSFVGNKNIGVRVEIKEDSAYAKLRREGNMSTKRIKKKVSKRDLQYTIDTNGVNVVFAGASLKTNLTQGDYVNGQLTQPFLTVHSNASLLNFMRREAKMSDGQIESLSQMLAGHGNDSRVTNKHYVFSDNDLTLAWETIKEGLKYKGLVGALSGVNVKEFSAFMIIGDRIVSVEHVLNQIISELEKPGTGTIVEALFSGPVDKSDYTAKWVSGKGGALRRSTDAKIGLGRLNKATITIKLLVNDTQALLKM